jgi:hypothetical protein
MPSEIQKIPLENRGIRPAITGHGKHPCLESTDRVVRREQVVGELCSINLSPIRGWEFHRAPSAGLPGFT